MNLSPLSLLGPASAQGRSDTGPSLDIRLGCGVLICKGSAKSFGDAGMQSRIGGGSDNDLSMASMLAISSDIFQKGVFGLSAPS